MWDGLFILVILCIVMAGASFLAGNLPLTLSLSSRHMRLISALGTGVLVGTALIVIIPEGIETLYSASRGEVGNALSMRSLITPQPRVNTLEALNWPRYISFTPAVERSSYKRDDEEFKAGPDGGINDKEDKENNKIPTDEHDEDPESHTRDPHTWVGLALIAGFILMYLIDTMPRCLANTSRPRRFSISLTSLSLYNPVSQSNQDTTTASQEPFHDPNTTTRNHSRPSSTTIGLVIHAIADGIALGASSATTSRLTFIIFIALMLHKAPAAFGLTSVLVKQGLSRRVARTHLIMFSAAAPIGALLTWTAAHLFGYSSSALGENSSTEFATGVLLLFSAGTFLYVAMHTMQESHSAGGHAHSPFGGSSGGAGGVEGGEGGGAMNGHLDGYNPEFYGEPMAQSGSKEGSGLTDTLVTVGGMLLPLLTQFGHGH